jgi:hypothetical protein
MSELALLSKPVLMRRLALAAIAAKAGLFYAWALGRDTLEYYYGAAVRSMSMSWHNFIFGAFDPAGSITLDKLPGAFWSRLCRRGRSASTRGRSCRRGGRAVGPGQQSPTAPQRPAPGLLRAVGSGSPPIPTPG